MARLATHVHVHDEHGTLHVFGPADIVPEWAIERITNPKAWAQAPGCETETPAYPDGAPAEGWRVPELVAYAGDRGIDLGDAKKKGDILALIGAAHDESTADSAAAQ